MDNISVNLIPPSALKVNLAVPEKIYTKALYGGDINLNPIINERTVVTDRSLILNTDQQTNFYNNIQIGDKAVTLTGNQTVGGVKTFTSNISALNLSGTNTGDQDLSSYALTSNLGTAAAADSSDFAPARGLNDNYVTDSEKTIIGNTSGTNTGDQDLSSYALTSNLGTAAAADSSDFASSAQGLKADSALQPSSVDYRGAYDNGDGTYAVDSVVLFDNLLYKKISNPGNPGYPPGGFDWILFEPLIQSPAYDLWVQTSLNSKADVLDLHDANKLVNGTSIVELKDDSNLYMAQNGGIVFGDGAIQTTNTGSYLATFDPKTINGPVTFNGNVDALSNFYVEDDLNVSGFITGDGSQVGSLNANNISSGTLSVARGGTGGITFASGALLVGAATGALTTLTPGTGVASALASNTNGTGGFITWNSSPTFDRITFTHLQGVIRITPDVGGMRLGRTGNSATISWTSGTQGGTGTLETGISPVNATTLGIGNGSAGNTSRHLALTNLIASGTLAVTGASTFTGLATANGGLVVTTSARVTGAPVEPATGDSLVTAAQAYGLYQPLRFTRTSAPTGWTGSDGLWTGTIPAHWNALRIFCREPGAGGGSGRRGTTGTACAGGGGGAGGALAIGNFIAAELPSRTLTVRVGLGGVGGAGVTTDDTNGNAGSVGGVTSVVSGSTLIIAAHINQGGAAISAPTGGGSGGTSTAGAGGFAATPNTTTLVGISGFASSITQNAFNSARRMGQTGGAGGAGGGGLNAGTAEYAGGVHWGGGSGTTNGSKAESSAVSESPTKPLIPGAGGSGSGATRNGFSSGKGGDGADGEVFIYPF